MSKASKVAVIGSGAWGTTFAKVLCDAGNSVVIWSRRPDLAEQINRDRLNSRYLPQIVLPEGLSATVSLAEAVADAQQIYISLPSAGLRQVLRELVLPPEATVVSLMKGVEPETGKCMSAIIEDCLPISPEQVAVISGPNLAYEIARENPAAAVAASRSLATAELVAQSTAAPYFYCLPSTDLTGVELAGVLKNLVALIGGIIDGLGMGDNTKAALITLGLSEIAELLVASGGQRETVFGLSSLGDVIATSQSPKSRNNRFGRMLGEGMSPQKIKETYADTVEGVAALPGVLVLARNCGVQIPIIEALSQVVTGQLAPERLPGVCLSQVIRVE